MKDDRNKQEIARRLDQQLADENARTEQRWERHRIQRNTYFLWHGLDGVGERPTGGSQRYGQLNGPKWRQRRAARKARRAARSP